MKKSSPRKPRAHRKEATGCHATCLPQRVCGGQAVKRKVPGLANSWNLADIDFVFTDGQQGLEKAAMLKITQRISIPDEEIAITAIRAQGAGGQHVNKVASAVHLRFDIRASSLPEAVQARLLRSHDRRISKDGVIVIKAQEHRTFERNREAARQRLAQMIHGSLVPPKKRRPTRPTRRAVQRRVDHKTRRGRLKRLRRKVDPDN